MRCEASHKRVGSNLEAKRKRLSIVFAMLFAAKQGADRAECKRSVEATADDYATVEGNEKSHLRNQIRAIKKI